MPDEQNKRIDAAAGVAIAKWESQFSTELLAHAKTLATRSNSRLVTLEHLRQAAGPAVEKLLVTIKGEQETDGRRKAA